MPMSDPFNHKVPQSLMMICRLWARRESIAAINPEQITLFCQIVDKPTYHAEKCGLTIDADGPTEAQVRQMIMDSAQISEEQYKDILLLKKTSLSLSGLAEYLGACAMRGIIRSL
jgi:hypothetical protein